MKIPFSIGLSNFTTVIKSPLGIFYFIKYERSRKIFSAYNKIKADIKLLPVKIDYQKVKYNNTGTIDEKLYADKIYMVDITSCYTSILKNKKLISDSTYKYLSDIPKKDRLAAVGMMASRKNVFYFNDNGKIENQDIEISEYSDYFFYCVQETFDIMDKIKMVIGKDYLFSWVDAVYFKHKKNAKIIQDYLLKEHNLKSTFNTLTEFEIELRENYYRLRYTKDNKKTFMDIPTIEQSEKKELLNYFLNTKINDNEFSKIKNAFK